MEVLIASQGMDTGGQGVRIAQAFRRHAPDWTVRAMHITETFIGYPTDEPWSLDRARELYASADVVHHKNGLGLYAVLDQDQRKPAIIHHQGTRLRTNPGPVTDEGVSIGAVQLVSTVDLLADCPPAQWLPTPYDLDEIAALRRRRDSTRVRIAHAPTNRKAKGTDKILQTIARLQRRGFDIETDLIEHMPWMRCLRRKARADIYVDQITNGYGNNTVECMAMGIPVVTGWADRADVVRLVEETGAPPQFLEGNIDTLEERLQMLIESAVLREEWGERGRAYAREFHDERRVVDRLQKIYSEAPASLGPGAMREAADSAKKRELVTA